MASLCPSHPIRQCYRSKQSLITILAITSAIDLCQKLLGEVSVTLDRWGRGDGQAGQTLVCQFIPEMQDESQFILNTECAPVMKFFRLVRPGFSFIATHGPGSARV